MTNKNYNIPDQLITEIAQEIDMGMVCFINPETLELESILGNSYIYGDTEEFNQEIFAKVNKWKKYIHIEPLESRESFLIMEKFIQCCIPDKDRFKEELWNAISRPKSFQHFKIRIDNSRYRQNWFDFKQEELEKYVREQLRFAE
ncbi:UPF0158 family protein [uncultured Parabacteroides sp.]|uniref:UPF0158 family protein n=1 Tax=uncultured Parabacteroides sp. TaxID=512312 RepID=UPI002603E174|nr:UPF0158 family protein [uncultured Parabacteroides sp.]